MITNVNMDGLLQSVIPIGTVELPVDMREFADAPWGRGSTGVISPGGPPPQWTRKEEDVDPAGLMETELEVNEVGIDDDDLVDDSDDHPTVLASRAYAFAGACLLRASGLPEHGSLRAVVNVGVSRDLPIRNATVRFFVERERIPQRYVDLDRFAMEAIAIIGPADLSALGLDFSSDR